MADASNNEQGPQRNEAGLVPLDPKDQAILDEAGSALSDERIEKHFATTKTEALPVVRPTKLNPQPGGRRWLKPRKLIAAAGAVLALGFLGDKAINSGPSTPEASATTTSSPAQPDLLDTADTRPTVEVIENNVAKAFMQDFANEIGEERRDIEATSTNGRENPRYNFYVNAPNPTTSSYETGIRAMYDTGDLDVSTTESGLWVSQSPKDGSITVTVFGTNAKGEQREVHFTTNASDPELDKAEPISQERGGGIETTALLNQHALDDLLGDRANLLAAAKNGDPIENRTFEAIKDL